MKHERVGAAFYPARRAMARVLLWSVAICSLVSAGGIASAAPPAKPKSQQDMMKMLDEYDRTVSRAPMPTPTMNRGGGGMRPMPGMRGGMPMGGGYMGRGMQPRPVGHSNAAMLQALKQRFEKMHQNQPAMMQMLQGAGGVGAAGALGGAMGGGMGGGMGGNGFMQMLQQKMQQAPQGGQPQKFGGHMPGMNPGMNPAMMRSPQPGAGMGQFGGAPTMQRSGMSPNPPAFKRLGQHPTAAPAGGSMQDLESQMNAQYGR